MTSGTHLPDAKGGPCATSSPTWAASSTASSIRRRCPTSAGAPSPRWKARWPSAARGPPREVLDEYETYSGQVDAVVTMAQDPPMSETELPLGDLGTHPMSIFASMFCFDNYCHLRHDILEPARPGRAGRAAPRRRLASARPSSGCSRGCRGCRSRRCTCVDRPVALVLTGPGGGTWTIAPGGDDGRVRGDGRRGRRCRGDDHVRCPRLRGLGDAAPPLVRVRDDRGRRALRVHRPRRHPRLLSPWFWRHLTTVPVAVCRQNRSWG